MALVEIPGIIQAPAWCELKPCGCTLCRECFTSVIATCEISYPVPPPSSSNSAPNGQTASIPASSNIHEAQKKFNCVVCRASCTEFGPINGELQDVVESAKAADAQYVNDHATATGGGIILRQDEVDKIEGPITTVIRDFDGFQSAQDIALGKIKYPNPKLNPDDGTSGSVSCSSTVSPLLRPELSETLNRRAKSDSALSLPHSPLFFHAENAGDQSIPTSEIKDLTNSVGSLHFPSLQRMENVTVPSRKVSNTTSVSISTTATLESPQAYSTPDLAAWSASSSASASSAPSSPVTMQSPILAMRFADTTLKEVPWRHEAVPTHYEKGNMPEKNAHVVDSKKTSTQVATTQNEKKDQGSVGLGLTFGSVPPSASSEAAAGTLSARIQSQPDQKAISSKPVSREGSVSPANNKKSKSKNKDPTGINVSTAASLMSAENVHKYDDKGQSPATPHRNTRPDAHVTPSRSLRGRGRGRGGSVRGGATGGGGYIAAHQARMAQVAQQSSPLKPSANFSFNPIHSRTSTQSSITNTTSSPASSRGSSWTFHPHGRKVSKAENRSSILPDYLANPTQEQISIWEDNKSKWWIDPWLGKPMGVRERLIDGTKVTCASDGKPLTRGKAAGISWPVLKVRSVTQNRLP